MSEITVVIPLFNKENEIRRTVQSVLAQHYKDFELLIVNDGSTDSSRDILRNVSDRRVRVIDQHNAGECAARNSGILNSHCKIVSFLDADDEWLPEFLSVIMSLRTAYPEAGVYGTGRFNCDGAGRMRQARVPGLEPSRSGGIVPRYFQTRGLLWSSSIAVKKDLFATAGLFREGIRRGGDLDMWFRLAAHSPIAYSPRALAVYHLDAHNRACNLYQPQGCAFMRKSLSEIEYCPEIEAETKADARRYLSDLELESVLALLAWGERKAAISLLDEWPSQYTRTTKWGLYRMLASCPKCISGNRMTFRAINVGRRLLECVRKS